MREPTISQLHGGAGYAVKAAVPRADLPSLIRTITVMIERRQWTESEAHLMRGIIKDLVGGRRARQKPTDGGG